MSKNESNWQIIVDYLRGDKSKNLTNDQYLKAFELCDGFGHVSKEFIVEEIEFDWSHVRDSSDIAKSRCADYLRGL